MPSLFPRGSTWLLPCLPCRLPLCVFAPCTPFTGLFYSIPRAIFSLNPNRSTFSRPCGVPPTCCAVSTTWHPPPSRLRLVGPCLCHRPADASPSWPTAGNCHPPFQPCSISCPRLPGPIRGRSAVDAGSRGPLRATAARTCYGPRQAPSRVGLLSAH